MSLREQHAATQTGAAAGAAPPAHLPTHREQDHTEHTALGLNANLQYHKFKSVSTTDLNV